jgi:hypothetical protein
LSSLQDILARSAETIGDLDVDSDDLYEQVKKALLSRLNSDTSAREWLARWTAVVVAVWLLLVYFILIGNDKYFKLSDTVLITLVTTTTLNVLGLPIIVLRNLFPEKGI